MWLPPIYDEKFEIAHGFRLEDLREALRKYNDSVAAVVCLSYPHVSSRVLACADVC